MNSRITVAAAIAFWLSSSIDARAVVQIGLAGPMTGELAPQGDQMKKGAELAVSEINAAGGVLGEKLELVVGDDACDPKQAIAVANQLIKLNIKLVVGHLCPQSSMAAAEAYHEDGVLQIAIGSAPPELTEKQWPSVFRLGARDDQNGAIAGRHVASTYAGKRVVVLRNGSRQGKNFSTAALEALEASGGVDLTCRNVADSSPQEIRSLVHGLDQRDVVILGTGAGAVDDVLDTLALNGPMVIANIPSAQSASDLFANRMHGSVTATSVPKLSELGTARSAVEALSRQGIEPTNHALWSYGAVQAYAAAVRRSGSSTVDSAARSLQQNGAETGIGHLSFDGKGDLIDLPYQLVQWRAGQPRINQMPVSPCTKDKKNGPPPNLSPFHPGMPYAFPSSCR